MARNEEKKRIFSEISSANITCCYTCLKGLTNTFLAMFCLSTYQEWFANYRWKTAEQDDKSAFTVFKGPFRVNSQDVFKTPSPIFLKFYSNCHYPIWWTPAKFKWKNLSRNGMIINLFSWGCVARAEQIKPYYCQTTLVNSPNISGMLVTLPTIDKISLSTLWLSEVKGHGPPNLTVSISCYKFSKIFKPGHGFISW